MNNYISIINEKFLPDYPKSMDLEEIGKAVNQMKKSICKIKIGEGSGTGFFCNIPLDNDNLITVLMTNNHVLEQKDIVPGKKIEISLLNEKINKEIYINEQRRAYTYKDYDVTIIEIKKNDNIDKDSFLDIDEDILKMEPENIIKRSVYLLHYPHYPIGKGVQISHGIICELKSNKYTIKHYCDSNQGSSGGPLINSNNNKVIAIHRGTPENNNKQYNIGSFLKEPILKFREEILIKENEKNILKIKEEKKEMNLRKKKETYSKKFKKIFDSSFKDLNERIEGKFKENSKQINSLLNYKVNENF